MAVFDYLNPYIPSPKLTADTPDFVVPTPSSALNPQEEPGGAGAVYFDPTARAFVVNGAVVPADNDTAIAATIGELDKPARSYDTQPGWVAVDPQAYRAYVSSIQHPGIGRLMAKNFGIGVDNLQSLVGHGLRFAGAEETGTAIVKQQEKDLAKNLVYQRQIENVGDSDEDTIFNWFVANLAQQGPNLVESALAASVGAVAGAVAGGGANPVSAAGGALMGLAGKTAVKQSMLAAAKKYAAKQALTSEERKMLREQASLLAAARLKNGATGALPTDMLRSMAATQALNAGRRQGAWLGGTAAAAGSGYGMGVSDVYGEGYDPATGEQNIDRSVAGMLGIPYAAFELMPEFILAGRVLGGIGGGVARAGMSWGRKALDMIQRAGTGGALGGLANGFTEEAQEALLIAANPDVTADSDVGATRLGSAFAAGFGVGLPLGAGAHAFGRRGVLPTDDPVNILSPTAEWRNARGVEEEDTILQKPAPRIPPRERGALGSVMANPAQQPTDLQQYAPAGAVDENLRQAISGMDTEQLAEYTRSVSATLANSEQHYGDHILARQLLAVLQQEWNSRRNALVPVDQLRAVEPVPPPPGATPPSDDRQSKVIKTKPLSAEEEAAHKEVSAALDDLATAANTITAQMDLARQTKDTLGPEAEELIDRINDLRGAYNPAGKTAMLKKRIKRLKKDLADYFEWYDKVKKKPTPTVSAEAVEPQSQTTPVVQPDTVGAEAAQAALAPSEATAPQAEPSSTAPAPDNAKSKKTKKPKIERVPTAQLPPELQALPADVPQAVVEPPAPAPQEEKISARKKKSALLKKIKQAKAAKSAATAAASTAASADTAMEKLSSSQLKAKIDNAEKSMTDPLLSPDMQDLWMQELIALRAEEARRRKPSGRVVKAAETAPMPKIDMSLGAMLSGETVAPQTTQRVRVVEAQEEAEEESATKFTKTSVAQDWETLTGENSGIVARELAAQRLVAAALSTDSNIKKVVGNNVWQWLNDESVDELIPQVREVINEAIVNWAVETATAGNATAAVGDRKFASMPLSAYNKGKPRLWYVYATKHALLGVIEESGVTITHVPGVQKPSRRNKTNAPVVTKPAQKTSASVAENKPAKNLASSIADFVTGIAKAKNKMQRDLAMSQMESAFELLSEEQREYYDASRGQKLSDWFDEDGKMYPWSRTSNGWIPATESTMVMREAPDELFEAGFDTDIGSGVIDAYDEAQDPDDEGKFYRGTGNNGSFRVPDGWRAEDGSIYTVQLGGADTDRNVKEILLPPHSLAATLLDAEIDLAQNGATGMDRASAKTVRKAIRNGVAWFVSYDFPARDMPTHLNSITIAKYGVGSYTEEQLYDMWIDGAYRDRMLARLAAMKSFARDDMPKFRFRGEDNKISGTEIINVIRQAYEGLTPAANFIRVDNDTPAQKPTALKTKLVVKKFLSKLTRKPNVHVFQSLTHLKNADPDLYKRAKAARGKKMDFDHVKAAAYSFGNDIIVFSNFIRTDEHLRFVLAHEVLGHQGLRAFLTPLQLRMLLTEVYNSSHKVKAAIDAYAEMHGLDTLEATEEWVADQAAVLDSSILKRVWYALKNALNAMGFRFDDDVARYMVSQARRYMRTGGPGIVMARGIYDRLTQLDQQADDGRFALATPANGTDMYDAATTWLQTAGLNREIGQYGGLSGAIEFMREKGFRRWAHNEAGSVNRAVAKILEHVQSLDNVASRSDGLHRVFRIFQQQSDRARRLMSNYNNLTLLTHSFRTSTEDKRKASQLLAEAALYKGYQATDQYVNSFKGDLTLSDAYGNITLNKAPGSLFEQLFDAGFVTAEEFRKGLHFVDSLGVRHELPAHPDLREESTEWKIYVEQRRAVAEAAVDLLLANLQVGQEEAQSALDRMTEVAPLNTDARALLMRVTETYLNIMDRGIRDANDNPVDPAANLKADAEAFLIAATRAMYSEERRDDWLNKTSSDTDQYDRKVFNDPIFDWFRDGVKNLHAQGWNQKQVYRLQALVRDQYTTLLQRQDAETFAKRTILSSYAPLQRRGGLQVKITAYDTNDKLVRLHSDISGVLPYYRVDSQHEADSISEQLTDLFGDREWDFVTEDETPVKVILRPEISTAALSPDLEGVANINDFVYILNRYNIHLAPKEREAILLGLTQTNAAARRNLQRTGNPGFDPDIVRSIAEYLETNAHVAAKKIFWLRLHDTMLKSAYWLGNDNTLKQLKAAVENAPNEEAQARAQRNYDRYAYMYRYMKAGGTVEINGKQVPTLGRGEQYKEAAKKLIRWRDNRLNITDSTEDILSTGLGSNLKMAAVLMQLGGNLATAMVNLFSLVTHTVPYLSFYNAKRGFGEGYGMGKVARTLAKTTRQVKNWRLSEPDFLARMDEKTPDGAALRKRYELTDEEVSFLRKQTDEGTLQAAAFNALLGTSRGRIFNNRLAGGIKGWMWMFSYTEQLNRRATALTAFRLERDRLTAEGGLTNEEIIEHATEVARRAVNTSQGEYAMYNRPEMARGNVLQYVFMYKQFVIITVQLLRGLPPAGRLAFLSLLLACSGIKGLPFAEDLLDLINTLCEKFGIKIGDVHAEMSKAFNEMIPGSASWMMHGVLDSWTGATVSSRLGLGDLVPLTGAMRAGADPWRETLQFVGPVASGVIGLFGLGSSLAKWGAEAVGLRRDVTSLNQALRESPIAAARIIGDTAAYLSDGSITNVQGRLISKYDVTQTTVARLLGFFPAVATMQNDIVRYARMTDAYAKEVKASFVAAYLREAMKNHGRGDREAMENVVREVTLWNSDAAGTGLEIKNFRKSAIRAVREAKRPTVLRYSKIAPTTIRPVVKQLLAAHGLSEEELN